MERSILFWVCVFALGMVPLNGCSETAGDGGTGGAAGTGGEGGGNTVGNSVFVTEAPGLAQSEIFTGAPLQGVEVCEVDDPDNCVTTDAEGKATLMLPTVQETGYTLEMEGYMPYLVPDVVIADHSTTWPMFSNNLAAELSDMLMTPYPWTGGVIILAEFPRMAGVTFDLVGVTAEGFYAEESGDANPNLTATTSDGRGGFYEVSAGEYEVEFGGTATTCTRTFGWPAAAANQIRVPSRVGYMTYGAMTGCDAP